MLPVLNSLDKRGLGQKLHHRSTRVIGDCHTGSIPNAFDYRLRLGIAR